MSQNLSTSTPALSTPARPLSSSVPSAQDVTGGVKLQPLPPTGEPSKRPTLQNRPNLGDPQFDEWFYKQRGARDLDRESVLNLCIASLIMGARDLLNTRDTTSSNESRRTAEYWVTHPMDTRIPFAFCCHMAGIRLPIEQAQRMYMGNLVAIAGLNMPNTGFPLETPA
ncbi:MAG: hypothetical protein ACYDCF_08700 [Burkholderiales bacterium]